jgi:hypothetical protein
MPQSGETKPVTDAPLTPVDRALRLLTSWVGQLTGLFVAAVLFIAKFQELDKALAGFKEWRFAIYAAVGLLLLLPLSLTIRDALRKKPQIDIASLKPGYFTLAPREQEENLYRTDGEHEKILRWLERRRSLFNRPFRKRQEFFIGVLGPSKTCSEKRPDRSSTRIPGPHPRDP